MVNYECPPIVQPRIVSNSEKPSHVCYHHHSQIEMKGAGWGINEALIISILPHTNEAQGGLIVEVGALSLSIEILQNKRLNIR
ncbi:uncharacterized protein LOC117922697 isoform X1 [Vitis riparia]|uniref:uncharacterized protein LOC117911859 isoform X1 n=1 Tax=Vitis riparia TaxID=96939 RepID=UPI00155A5A82|nr:uncharacterized protein LOC117911859 isoform X1 [Vitis riparia]XP_034696769.1 uncharacterized protein LOC117922697 isoform X1 [Vitis riparia]